MEIKHVVAITSGRLLFPHQRGLKHSFFDKEIVLSQITEEFKKNMTMKC